MTETHGSGEPRGAGAVPEATQWPPSVDGGAGGRGHRPDIDWQAVERSREFRELTTRKRAFVVPATVFFLAWYFGFIVLAGYAPDFMGREFLTDGLTVGYFLALTQFVMVWVLGWLYLRKADRVFDPLAERAVARALDGTDRERGGRFERDAVAGSEVTGR
jgi:uncharacterized membrane protein (DUF485 family)